MLGLEDDFLLDTIDSRFGLVGHHFVQSTHLCCFSICRLFKIAFFFSFARHSSHCWPFIFCMAKTNKYFESRHSRCICLRNCMVYCSIIFDTERLFRHSSYDIRSSCKHLCANRQQVLLSQIKFISINKNR